MLDFDNTSAPRPEQSWPDWLRHIGALVAHADPGDPRIQFVANLIKDAAHEASLASIPDPLSHYRFRMEVAYELEPRPDNGPAAPIQPGVIAGHPAQWESDHQHEDAGTQAPAGGEFLW